MGTKKPGSHTRTDRFGLGQDMVMEKQPATVVQAAG